MKKIVKYSIVLLALSIWAALSVWAMTETVDIIGASGLSVHLEDIAILVSGVNAVGLVAFLVRLAGGQSVK
tara:strand:- start:786 stop:998 length:213 start_codon:yes stop_codon:yes gene_type:complete